jgi:hypothetical protein
LCIVQYAGAEKETQSLTPTKTDSERLHSCKLSQNGNGSAGLPLSRRSTCDAAGLGSGGASLRFTLAKAPVPLGRASDSNTSGTTRG